MFTFFINEATCQGEGRGNTELSNFMRVERVSIESSATKGAVSLFSEPLQPINKINENANVSIFIVLVVNILELCKSLVQVIKNK